MVNCFKYFLSIVLLCLPLSARAQYGAPPADINLDVPIVVQQNPQWCWLAVTEMAISYRNGMSQVQQCEILEQGYRLPPGSCCMNKMACTTTGQLQEIQQAMLMFGRVYSAVSPPHHFMALYDSLKRDIPIIADVRTGAQAFHAIIVRGMRFERRVVGYGPMGPMTQIIPIVIINDPMSYTVVEMPYQQLVQSWVASISILGGSWKRTAPSKPVDGANSPSVDQSTSSSGLCSALNRVIASVPSMNRIIKGRSSQDGTTTFYSSKVQLPGRYGDCTIQKDSEDMNPSSGTYICSVRDEERDCGRIDEYVRSQLEEVKRCFPTFEFSEESGKRTYDVRFKADPEEAGYSLILRVSQWSSEDHERCSGSIGVYSD